MRISDWSSDVCSSDLRRSRNDFAQRYFLHLAERPRAELEEAPSERRHDVEPVVGSNIDPPTTIANLTIEIDKDHDGPFQPFRRVVRQHLHGVRGQYRLLVLFCLDRKSTRLNSSH